ncbi:undecaprenyl-diphosphate phosphatase [Campylobacter sp. MIT 21-1685]|uniref:undecaprenyl-diphosphate phosphatase n=1 Tax=unclassified Campylobacter TaxID=2593542 RepID=UPI00224AA8A6|nr:MULTISPECIES: undecaprenyl-diphosphate phosphatase [unclassified Campylobacter]MCX2683457.1 undecaprenyl-diphosphate phosphatase [Campylobacter sp. MIT 21-1684]MCX2751721.1 undecaprenyl-diphosphate phosphatase [Campylobacter sp. MIT 21-1682]MCX2807923.1 undecaprenyl-diphosphate phosphatase [Campylobacter sp. MIT 21-1685]
MQNLYALILGIIEGLTEFLPISSTGHLILGMTILGIKIDDFWRSFTIIIQLGSILAVLCVFWKKLLHSFMLCLKLAVGFFPTGLIGLFVAKYLSFLFNGYVVVLMIITWGIVLIVIEKIHHNKNSTITSLEQISFKQAFCIGVFQSLAIIPGTSRSGASIIGGLLLGFNRKIAAEFSFLLAIPTMIAATAYSIYKEPQIFTHIDSFIPLTIGFITAFLVAFFVIKTFLKFISKISFIPFGIYRIALGLIFFYLYTAEILDAGSEFKL